MRIRDEKNSDPGYGKKSKPGSGIVRTARIRKKDIFHPTPNITRKMI
jgi:hypothetical protein